MRNLFLTSAAALALACGATAVSAQNPAAGTSANTAMTSTQKTTYDSWPADKKATYDKWPAEYQAYFWSLTPQQQTGWFALTDAQRKQVYEMPPASRAAAWASIQQQLAGGTAPSASAAPPSATTAPSPDAAAAPPMDNDAASAPAQAMPSGADMTSGAGAVDEIQANPPGPGPVTDTPPDPATANSPVAQAVPADPSYQAGPYKGALTAPPADAMNKHYPVCTRKIQDSCRNPGGI